jgi:DinB superfamily
VITARSVRSRMVTIHEPLIRFLTPERAGELAEGGLFADDLAGIVAAYALVGEQWHATVERARGLDTSRLDERVGGEWSFIETLRHLVFVTDTWVRDVIEEEASPNHPLGMPPDFLPAEVVAGMGLTVDARPSLDEVCALRDERRALVERVLAGLTPEDLARTCAPRGGQFQLVGALQTVLFEEWAHRQYATRDLSILERAADG